MSCHTNELLIAYFLKKIIIKFNEELENESTVLHKLEKLEQLMMNNKKQVQEL